MKTHLAAFLSFAFLLALLPVTPVHAEEKVTSILYTCYMSFKANGKSVYIGLGYTDVNGAGSIVCHDILTGADQRMPIKVKVRGPGAGLGLTGLNIGGVASGVGVSKGPENLLGRYTMVRGNAAVGVGAGASAGLHLSNGAVTIDVSIDGQTGLGAGVDLLFIDIESAGPMTVEAAPQPAQAAPKPVQIVTPVKTIYVSEGQPVQIIDENGKVLQTIYLKPAAPAL